MYIAMYDDSLTISGRVCHALNAFVLVAHHSASSLLICMLLVGVVDPQQFIIDPILILCVQHLFVLCRHANKNIYILIEIVLEAWFEWSILSNYENIVRNHWTVVLATSVMLFAHWMNFAAG